jgi:hypothetical protein
MINRSHHQICIEVCLGIFLMTLVVGCRESVQRRSLSQTNNPQYVEIAIDSLTSTNCHFKIRIHNISDDELEIRSAELPWNKLLVVLVESSGKIIPRSEYQGKIIRDWADRKEVIAPRHFLEHRTSLHDLFYETAIPMLKSQELVMFWSYRLEPLNHQNLHRVGGCIIIPPQK